MVCVIHYTNRNLLAWEGDRMTYVTSDIHGCYDRYEKMLEKIGFSDEDMLYVLGDVLDYGPQPLAVLQDMSMRANVIPILGNHEFAAYEIINSNNRLRPRKLRRRGINNRALSACPYRQWG